MPCTVQPQQVAECDSVRDSLPYLNGVEDGRHEQATAPGWVVTAVDMPGLSVAQGLDVLRGQKEVPAQCVQENSAVQLFADAFDECEDCEDLALANQVHAGPASDPRHHICRTCIIVLGAQQHTARGEVEAEVACLGHLPTALASLEGVKAELRNLLASGGQRRIAEECSQARSRQPLRQPCQQQLEQCSLRRLGQVQRVAA
mmetsp:Transcript_54219/g.158300  ORF Transcript_54219/g.158300 Transcript_54219/m.158300 type:complete len:202 (-) Transcript_54219:265-870(-)